MENGKYLNDESGHDNDRAEGNAKKSKAMLFLVKRHNCKTHDQGYNPDDHPLIVLFAERKFIHNYKIVQYSSSKDILRYLRMEKKVLSTATRIPISSNTASNIINCS